ncbi:MAG: phosphoenolpyruvate--protein phosphotransferase [Burkholderiaceae bacterium]|jgi:phosphoenolpyruvate-protein phosphotransferase (PTS system enzyme I)|nr:phosphoenolpyruvate--protein phosphotransferase [Burkholderiaceae bacterium]MDP4668978.1 phosphoenolpyruvate--protein phosphotransferase [Burkholderiaceae bacterium]
MAWSVSGIGVGDKLAIGRAWVLAPASLDLPRRNLTAAQIEPEIRRFQAAVGRIAQEFEDLRVALKGEPAAEVRAFLDLQAMVLQDPILIDETIDLIRGEQCNAEWALVRQFEEVANQFNAIDDPYLRERKADVQQLVERILKAMQGVANLSAALAQQDGQPNQDLPWILVARDIAPADMLLLRQHQFAGFATDSGSPTSHTAILARSLGLPAVVGMASLHGLVAQGEEIVLDAAMGVVMGSLDADLRAHYADQRAGQQLVSERLKRLKTIEAKTLDGERVQLQANLDLPEDAAAALEAGCDGVGLFRSEFLFMNRQAAPTESEQTDAYRRVVTLMAGRPITIRTLDSGADKSVAALAVGRAAPANPALALRAIRLCLAEPELFLTQLRAILRASAHGPVRIMIPLVSGPNEMILARRMIQTAMQQLDTRGLAYDRGILVGAMIEVPSAAIAIDSLLAHIDFASLGTNDLIQYTLAIDRTDSEVAHLYEPLHPAVLRLIRDVIRACDKANTPISLCGEMAGEPQFCRLLLGLGLRIFSMHPVELLRVKQEVLRARAQDLGKPVARLLKLPDAKRIRAGLEVL